jgi:hypothetical protein
MAGRPKTAWTDTHKNIRRAQALVARYDADKANPKDFIAPLSTDEQAAWDDLLNHIK